VLLVAVSGLAPGDYAGDAPVMPTLARLAAGGAAADDLEPVAPASRAPAHASLVTGRRPARHGIMSDRLLGEKGVRRAGFDHASYLRGPSLWSEGVAAGRSVAALGWPTTLGAAIPLLIPDLPPSRTGLPWLSQLGDTSTPWLVELAGRSGGSEAGADLRGPERDAALVGVACELVRAPRPPELLLLQLAQTAGALARAGAGSPEARAALASTDAELGRLLDCLAGAGRLASASVVVVGDAAFAPVHTALAPNAILERRGLLSRASPRELRGWRAIARANGGSAFVYARSEGDAVRARRALEAEAEEGGLFRVVPAQEMLALGADPEAWFGMEARPGYVFVDFPDAAPAAASARRAAAGYLPGRPDVRAGFVAWGRGVRARVRVPWMRQIDVAPTLARLAGVALPEAEGRAVEGVLDLRGDASPRPSGL